MNIVDAIAMYGAVFLIIGFALGMLKKYADKT